LIDHFGGETLIGAVTPQQADQWVIAMRKRYAGATVARLIKHAKQFFNAAIRAKLVTESPFTDIVSGTMTNPYRIRFVTREEIDRVLDACPDGEWRLIVALARFGGLRCPSELLSLTWDDIDWDKERFLVRSSKTGRRRVPLFPELRPHVEEAFNRAEEGAVQVVPRARFGANLRTYFEKIIIRAGLEPWDRLFQNLRASRETELAARFPLHVVTAWIGNSVAIASKHYLSVTEQDFERGARSGAVGGAVSGAVVVQNPVQSRTGQNRLGETIAGFDVDLDLKNVGKVAVSPPSVGLGRTPSKTAHYPQQESNLQPRE
jgi:integrase